MKSLFKRIGLIGKQRGSDNITTTLQGLIDLLRVRYVDFVIEADTAATLSHAEQLPTVTKDQLGHQCDLVIVVGGDGSLLNAARVVVDSGTPVLGINRGRLGFLTDVRPTELTKKINEILDGHYLEESRFLLTTHILDGTQTTFQDDALNDVVLTPGARLGHMIEFEIYINERFVCHQRADGLIVATPTGSTAYALSGGGPILHPHLNAIVLVPMFPHTLSSRPIVISGDCQIDIAIAKTNETSPQMSCDGRERVSVNPGDHIFIRKKSKELRLIHPTDYHYFETLRNKLSWETKPV